MANKKNNIEIIPAFTNDEKKLYKNRFSNSNYSNTVILTYFNTNN